MFRQKSFAMIVLLATTTLAACTFPTTEASGNPVGFGALTARTKGAGFTTSPVISFYRVTGAVFITTDVVRDTCFSTTYTDSTSDIPSSASPVTAGAFVEVRMGTRADTLRRAKTGVDPTYRTATAAGFQYVPGDSIVINVAGDPNGFPTSSFRGRTAEPFVVNPFTVPPLGSPINVTWTPAGGANAAMLMSFQYAAGNSTTRNRQLACTFVDDGAASVNEVVAVDWINATNRALTAQRIRTILEQVPVPRSYFNIISSYNWPTPVSP